jgi:phage host-nuclease inhibitor protein Gam
MKIGRFFQGSAHEDKDSQESAAVATLEPTESTEPTEEPDAPDEVVELKVSPESVVPRVMPPVPAGDEPNANGMRAAFAGVAAAVDGEVESLRRSLAELQRTLVHAVDGEKKARTDAVDGVQRELSSRIDEVVSGREKVVNELKQSAEQERKRVDGCVEEVKQSSGRERERVDGRLDEVKAAIEQSINAKVEKLSGKLDALGKNLRAFQLELQRQAETSEKVTALLNNMAGVFSDKKAQPSPAPGGAAQPIVTASADSAELGDQMEVDDALERVFK